MFNLQSNKVKINLENFNEFQNTVLWSALDDENHKQLDIRNSELFFEITSFQIE